MNIGILRLYIGESGKIGLYNVQEIGLAKALVNKQSDIKVFIFFLSEEFNEININEIEKNIQLVYIPCKSILNHGIFKLDILRQFELNILHILSDTQIYSGYIVKWCMKQNIKAICVFGTTKSSSKNTFVRFLINIIFNYNKKFFRKSINIAKTPTVYNELRDKGIKNLKLIPVGLDKTILKTSFETDISELRYKLSLPRDKKILLFVGRLADYKKPLFALKVFNKLITSDSQYFLVIIGDGELRDDVLSYIDENALKDNLLYINRINNDLIWQYYVACNIFINTNDKEIFGMSILEAMYYKCLVVAVEAPGPRFILNKGICGYLINNYDIDEWVKSIKNIDLFDDSIILKAKDTVDKEFCWDSIADKYIRLYEKGTLLKK